MLSDVKRFVSGRPPRPKIYAVINGTRRRVLSIGPDWVRVYRQREKCRVLAAQLDNLEIKVPLNGE